MAGERDTFSGNVTLNQYVDHSFFFSTQCFFIGINCKSNIVENINKTSENQTETMCCSRKFPYTSWKVTGLCPNPLPYHSGNSRLASCSPFNSLALENSLPLGISNDLPWGGQEIFWNCPLCLKHYWLVT